MSDDDPLDSTTALNSLRTARKALRDAEAALDAAGSVGPATFTGTPSTQLEKKREKVDEGRRLVEERRHAFEIASEEHREASRVRDAITAEMLARSNTAAANSVACWTKVLALLALTQAIAAGVQAYAACSPPKTSSTSSKVTAPDAGVGP
jgi:hypothetical protein